MRVRIHGSYSLLYATAVFHPQYSRAITLDPRGAFPYKPIRDVPFFRVSFSSIKS